MKLNKQTFTKLYSFHVKCCSVPLVPDTKLTTSRDFYIRLLGLLPIPPTLGAGEKGHDSLLPVIFCIFKRKLIISYWAPVEFESRGICVFIFHWCLSVNFILYGFRITQLFYNKKERSIWNISSQIVITLLITN